MCLYVVCFFFKQKTAYEMRISDWSSDVCSSDLDKFEVVVLEKKDVTYSYFADPMYVFMDEEYNQYEVEAENLGDALNYLEDGMQCEAVFYNGKIGRASCRERVCQYV